MICYACRDNGIQGGCPSCGKEPEQACVVVEEISEKVLDKFNVPTYYQGIIWSKATMLESHPNSQNDPVFKRYIDFMDKVHSIFNYGKIPGKSLLIISGHTMGKLTWAYSCMQKAIQYGHTVAPVIDNTQFKRLSIISSDRISSKYLKKINFTIEDYLYADIVFMTIDPDNFQGSYRTVDSLISKRSRNGKTTIILSRFSLEQMSILDYTDSANQLIYRQLQDYAKYLTIIRGPGK